MKITAKYHVTPTERKHIKLCVEKTELNPETYYKVGRKQYKFAPTEKPGVLSVEIYTKERADSGRMVTRKSLATVDINA